ncbi:MAG: L,D-transpeptidase family protein, partial [Bradyrhizobium sp.]|uniref:L,D-transpeptidase family protein n=1 Tax=Bradyrhizobium sp. TaxID=376 RepID=UPI00271B7449
PFMQRITWSGIAMHAGVLPGYPASHGCIRMPMAFAARIWNWTKMGARVVVTPGEITPARFAHPLLAEQKVAPPPPPTAAIEPNPDAPPAAKADKAADAAATVKPAISEASLELRSTVGHDGGKPVMDETSASRPLRDQTRTADASSAIPATSPPVTMSDALSSAASTGRSALREAAVAAASSIPLIAADAAAAVDDAPKAEAKSEAASAEAEPAAAKPDQIASSADQPAETKPSEAATAEIKPAEKPAETEAADSTEKKPDGPAITAQASGDAVKAEAPASETAKPDDSVTAATDPRPAAPEVTKDQTRLPNAEKAVVAKPEPPKPAGRIAVLVSRKDGKLYVRENFKPLFDVPVTIAPSDRLLGTHVFTAEVDKDDANALRWSVVSLPVAARNAQKNEDEERSSRRRRIAGVVPAEVKQPLPAPNSPAEALDRITIPPEAMSRIAEALSTGGSIVVSDQGINQGGETGEGTDFIVSLR